MEKRNVVEEGRTPCVEFTRSDEHWDKQAANAFSLKPKNEEPEKLTHVIKSES